MPSPSGTFQRPDLGLHFEEFDLAASRRGFVVQDILRIMEVALQTANFSVIPAESFLALRDTRRESGGGYSRQDWQFEQQSYACEDHGAEEPVDDRERAKYAYSFQLERVCADRARDAVLRRFEVDGTSELVSTSTFGNGAVSTAWDQASSTPIDDVLDAITTFYGQCGMPPNRLVISDVCLRALKKNAQVVDRLKYWGGDDPKTISADILSAMFSDSAGAAIKVLVASGRYNSADRGQAPTFATIWTSSVAGLYRAADTEDFAEPCVGRTFSWSADGGSPGGTVEQYRDERIRSDVIRVRFDIHRKIIYSSCGYLLTGVTT